MAADLSLVILTSHYQHDLWSAMQAATLPSIDVDTGDILGFTHADEYWALHKEFYRSLPHEHFIPLGPLSTAKAADDSRDEWIPGPLQQIMKIVPPDSSPVIITPALRANVGVAFNTPDRSHYARIGWTKGRHRSTRAQRVRRILHANSGHSVASSID